MLAQNFAMAYDLYTEWALDFSPLSSLHIPFFRYVSPPSKIPFAGGTMQYCT